MFLALAAGAQPSYWFSQFQKQGNAQLAQEYFFRAGNGITITYTNPGPYVWINSTGTNYTVAISTNALYSQFATNWLSSNAFYLLLTGQITNYTAGSNVTFTLTSPHTYRISSTGGGGGTNIIGDQVWTNDVANSQIAPIGSYGSSGSLGVNFGSPWLVSFFIDTNSGYSQIFLQSDDGSGTNMTSLQLLSEYGPPSPGYASQNYIVAADYQHGDLFRVDGHGDLRTIAEVPYVWPRSNANGSLTNDGSGNLGWSPSSGTTTGLTTNICVVFCDATTNTLNFTNGLLMAINGASGPSHAPSIILPGGGYLLQPSGSTILLP